MTYLLALDPGKNSGLVLCHYDAVTPMTLVSRWQVHGGVEGLHDWWANNILPIYSCTDIVCESFELRESSKFAADVTPLRIEGALTVLLAQLHDDWGWQGTLTYQKPSDKASLIGYSAAARAGTKTMRQRERYDFLDRFGMFRPGTEHDDSNDAVTHALVWLKRRLHMPTLKAYWPMRAVSLEG